MKTWTKIILVLIVSAVSGYVQASETCARPGQEGCWELVALNVAWEESNPHLQGLDKSSASEGERLDRAEHLGKKLWHAQHNGSVHAAGPASFLVFIWNGGEGISPTGFRVTGSRTIESYTAENVTDKVTATEMKGYGKPSAVYRVKTDGVSASLLLPRSVLNNKTFIVICREGKNGVYPNTTTLHQGHAISPETLAWYASQGMDGRRTLVPFVSKTM